MAAEAEASLLLPWAPWLLPLLVLERRGWVPPICAIVESPAEAVPRRVDEVAEAASSWPGEAPNMAAMRAACCHTDSRCGGGLVGLSSNDDTHANSKLTVSTSWVAQHVRVDHRLP